MLDLSQIVFQYFSSFFFFTEKNIAEIEPWTGLRSMERSPNLKDAGNRCLSGGAQIRPTPRGREDQDQVLL